MDISAQVLANDVGRQSAGVCAAEEGTKIVMSAHLLDVAGGSVIQWWGLSAESCSHFFTQCPKRETYTNDIDPSIRRVTVEVVLSGVTAVHYDGHLQVRFVVDAARGDDPLKHVRPVWRAAPSRASNVHADAH